MIEEGDNFSITNTTKNADPFSTKDRRLLLNIKNKILGKNYNLSLTLIGERRSQTLNRGYRGKDKPTDILSFPLDDNEGEIFLNLKRTAVEAKKFGRHFLNFVFFLFIHGTCHLKGMRHGSRMEGTERKYRKIFNV